VIPERTSRTGAFASPLDSKDSALAVDLPPGVYTSTVTGVESSGTALIEFYDADSDPTTATSRLTNLSTRGHLGQNEDVLIAGFTIVGSSPLRVLLRGIGPSLVDFSVSGYVSDPTIELFSATGVSLARNNRWDEQTVAEENANLVDRLISVSAQVGGLPTRPTERRRRANHRAIARNLYAPSQGCQQFYRRSSRRSLRTPVTPQPGAHLCFTRKSPRRSKSPPPSFNSRSSSDTRGTKLQLALLPCPRSCPNTPRISLGFLLGQRSPAVHFRAPCG